MFVLLLFDDGYLLARKQRHQPVRRVAVGSHSGSIYVGIDSFLGQKQPVIQGL